MLDAFLAYFDTGRANNGGTEAINELIELHQRVARGSRNRDHYRLRMLLIGGGLTHPHLRWDRVRQLDLCSLGLYSIRMLTAVWAAALASRMRSVRSE